MGLRDEVLAKQTEEEEKNNPKKNKKSKKEEKEVVEEPKKEEKTPAKKKPNHPPIEECKANYEKLSNSLEKNEVPAEWIEIWDKIFEKLKLELEKLPVQLL